MPMLNKIPRLLGFITRKVFLLFVLLILVITGGTDFLADLKFIADPLSQNQQQQTQNLSTTAPAIWTKTSSMSAEQNAAAHFKKHGRQFPFASERDYIQAAHDFLSNPPAGTLSVVQKDGDTVLYNPDLNYFAVKNRNGIPRTFFKPDPRIHGYKTNLDYFQAQTERR
jgi:pyocin large subunit-like protein